MFGDSKENLACVSCRLNSLKHMLHFDAHNPEAVAQRCPVKKVFLEISQNSQENTCARVSLLQLY